MDYETESDSQISSEMEEDESEHYYGSYEEEFHFEKKEKRFQEMNFLLGCLKNHFIFYNLSQSQLENVAKKMYYCHVPSDNFIFKEGSKSMWFFIIEKGMMHATSEGKVKKQLRVGDGFGEIALLYKTPRSFSVKACESCNLWGIDRNTFRKAVEEIIIKEYEQNKIFMETIRFFRCLSNDHKDAIAGSLIPQHYNKGQTIVSQGDPGSTFYVIKEGEASVLKGNKQIKKLGRGDTFGEQSLYYNTVRQMSVKAESDLQCLILSRETIYKVLGDQIFVVTFRNFIRWSIEKSSYLSKLSKEEIEKIIDLMRISTYKAGNVVIKKSVDGRLPTNQKIIIILEGAMKKAKNIYPIASRSQTYGEEFLLHNRGRIRYDDDIIMESNGVLAEIKADLVKEIIGGEIDVIISMREREYEISQRENEKKREKKCIQSIKDLTVLKEMKKSSLGPNLIVACEKQKKPQIYLLKCLKKEKLEHQALNLYKIEENSLQRTLIHPLIVEGYKVFEDSDYFYNLVQFIRGEEFYDVIRQIGLLSTEDAQFYTAQIVLIMEYLAQEGIYLRDIKPEMFMVDMQGYLALTDLVSAKKNEDSNIKCKTYTMIGTPHYMAPQIILNKGYNYSCSLYSLGINLFEMMCGYVPFGEKTEDPLEIYEDVLNSELKFPKGLKDNKAKKLIEQLLKKEDPDARMGGPTFDSLKNHPWFHKINWEELLDKEVNCPHFERYPNIEETESELLRFMKHGKNCQDFLNDEESEHRREDPNLTSEKFNDW